MENLIKEQKSFSELTFDLDSEFGSIGSTISTLVDAEALLGQLVDSMDTAIEGRKDSLTINIIE